VKKEDIDLTVDQLIVVLDSDVRHSEQYSLIKENYFDTFAELYNDSSITGSALRGMIYERWIENRVKLLDELITSWEDWAFAWDNADNGLDHMKVYTCGKKFLPTSPNRSMPIKSMAKANHPPKYDEWLSL
jgi:hypothetical protein